MKIKDAIFILALIVVLSGCLEKRVVTLGQLGPPPKIATAAFIPQEGNSPEMDSYIQQQLLSYGVILKVPLPAGTRWSQDVDAIVVYSDVWSWDIVMYLKALTIKIFHGPTGKLLVTGRWDSAVFHEIPFSTPQEVIKELLDDMFSKWAVEKMGQARGVK